MPGDLIRALGRYDTWSFDFLSFKVSFKNRRAISIRAMFIDQAFQLEVGAKIVLKSK